MTADSTAGFWAQGAWTLIEGGRLRKPGYLTRILDDLVVPPGAAQSSDDDNHEERP